MFGLGPLELGVIFLIILLVFGAKRIPEIAQGLGKGITEFKKAARDVTSELDSATNTPVSPPPAPQARNEVNSQPVSNELRNQQAENTPPPPEQSQQS
ncbi:twin-arginine translocase TatA/TatE family subunit [Candidatus Latescibacterota bacterium]